MKIIDELTKKELNENEITPYSGELIPGELLVKHHDAVPEIQEASHMEIVAEYPNGGKDIVKVIDVPYSPAVEEYDEYEDVYYFRAYTPKEAEEARQRAYKAAIEKRIRMRYTIDDEIAILRQKEAKPNEYQAYYEYCEECKKIVKEEMSK